MSKHLLRTLTLVGLSLMCSHALAADEDAAVPGYYRTEWTTKAGAPSYISSIAQAPEGYLWLGASTGLYRFDGAEFERYQGRPGDELPVGRVNALNIDRNGDLWLVAASREVLKLQNGRVVFRQRLPENIGTVSSFVRTAGNHPILVATNGILEFSGSSWHQLPRPGVRDSARIYDILTTRDGALWIATEDGIFHKALDSKTFTSKTVIAPGHGKFSQSPDSAVWYCGDKTGLHKFAHDGRVVESNASLRCYHLFVDSRAIAWMDGELGAGVGPIDQWPERSSSQTRANLTHALFGKEVTYSIFEDKEGSIWLGCTDGLRQFRQTRLLTHPDEGGSGGIAPAQGGGLWLVSYVRGLIHLGTSSETFKEAGKQFTYITRGPDGIVWAGGNNRDVLIRIEGRQVQEVPFPPGKHDVFVKGIAIQRDGSPWVLTEPSPAGSLYHLKDGTWLKNDGNPELPNAPPTAVYVDTHDRVWITYAGSRIFNLDKGRLTSFPEAPAMNLGAVRSIAAYGRDVVFAGEGGMAILRNGRFQRFVVQAPIELIGIATALQTHNGDLWVNQPSALLRFTSQEIERFLEVGAPLQPDVFNFKDGRRGPPFPVAPHPTLAQTDEGKLWVAAINLTSIDPVSFDRNRLRPSAVFRHVLIDGVPMKWDRDGLSLKSGVRELVVGYMSSSIAASERVHFRYKMEGLDPEWRHGNAQREATYNQLQPGTYSFRILASNNDGIWSEERAIPIEVLPPYYQTRWFIALCILGASVILALLIRARTRWVADRIRLRLEARSHERERIARELHDTLLQGIQGLILQLHLVADDLPIEDENRRRMEGALDRADRLMDEGRQRVNDLRLHVVGAGIGQSLRRQLSEDYADATCRFRVREWGEQQALTPTVQIELLRVAHEAVSNALHHADCHRVHLVIRYDRDALRMRIWDDGCGISANELSRRKPLHWGITGMQERAKSIGAQLHMGAGKSRGTAIDLVIPANTAYINKARRRWRRAFWRYGAK